MKFALIKINGSKSQNQNYVYSSTIMEMGASPKWTKSFKSENEIIDILSCLLSKQDRPDNVGQVLSKLRKNGEYYFFDLNLTHEEAGWLGWKNSPHD
jgi:hypothetical protein